MFGRGEKEILHSLPATETGMSAGLMDCLGHYADLTSTAWAAICRTSACAKCFTQKSLDFHANDRTGDIYFHTNSSHKDSFCHRSKSKLGIGPVIHELLREPLIWIFTIFFKCLWLFGTFFLDDRVCLFSSLDRCHVFELCCLICLTDVNTFQQQ